MKKLILTGVTAAAALGLAACGYEKNEYNEEAGYNAEETNYTENAADYGNTANDMNMTDEEHANMSNDTAGNNATGNEAIDNRY